MAQRTTPPGAPAGGGGDGVGPYTLGESLRRDRLGELFAATGPEGAVRVRICPAQADPRPVTQALDRLAAVRHSAVAPLLDQFVDAEGRVAVVAPADRWTLADRHRRGRLDPPTLAPLGCVLFDGLAALHAAGLQHGAVRPAAVGIDAEGAARWQDAGLLAALTRSRMPAELRSAADVAECAAMLRDLGRLPPAMQVVLDPVAAGVPGAPDRAAAVAEAWRAALEKEGLPVPPPGVRARIPGLLPPPPKAAKPRRPLPRWARLVAAGLLVAAALGVVPAAALGPGGGPLLDRIDAYAPLHKGLRLTYRLRTTGVDGTVTLVVTDSRVIAGRLTATLEGHTGITAGAAGLPLGLAGGTIRVNSDSLVRTTSGGSVRDLALPLFPGSRWQDHRSGVLTEQTVDETRVMLGPVSLAVPAGHYDRCAAVGLTSVTRLPAAAGSSGAGLLWYCPGVGLARALLEASGQVLEIDLVSVH